MIFTIGTPKGDADIVIHDMVNLKEQLKDFCAIQNQFKTLAFLYDRLYRIIKIIILFVYVYPWLIFESLTYIFSFRDGSCR